MKSLSILTCISLRRISSLPINVNGLNSIQSAQNLIVQRSTIGERSIVDEIDDDDEGPAALTAEGQFSLKLLPNQGIPFDQSGPSSPKKIKLEEEEEDIDGSNHMENLM
ncbi:hypothetical protein PFISCL1PPCAC_20848, partial [Pristionchus fissidentatus]